MELFNCGLLVQLSYSNMFYIFSLKNKRRSPAVKPEPYDRMHNDAQTYTWEIIELTSSTDTAHIPTIRHQQRGRLGRCHIQYPHTPRIERASIQLGDGEKIMTENKKLKTE